MPENETEQPDRPETTGLEASTTAAATAGARHFNCRNCGSSLLFKPGTTQVKCPYCGTVNDIPKAKDDDDYLKENDFITALALEEKRQEQTGTTEAEVVKCPSCGATTTLSPTRTSENCPYCGSPLSMQNHFGIKLNVQALLPFKLDADKAMQIYRDWVKGRWFAPNDFARRATREKKLDGVYMPYWTYDADTRTSYTGQRGDAYYTTESYYVTVNGRQEERTEQVRHINWSRASGTVDVAFDDVLVPASRSLPGHLCDRLEPWGLHALKPFQQEFLSGFITEAYQLSLREGFDDAKRRMAPAIDSAIRNDIGGDEQQIDSMDSKYDSVTFKHILLPVWLSAYAYGGETFRFMINAQTGEVSGERPWSWIKIGLAVAAGLAAVGGLIYYLYQSGAFDSLQQSGVLDILDVALDLL